ncbi:hypothetical protein [Endozoicomonas sp. Mp262]|uniref:hypothetical protein n=1 Tax=Endozoicomonas sp. Mp262 TaxID=2919499 RepID=UPI0021DB5785
MFSYIVDGESHTDTSPEYLKKLGLDDDEIESITRDACEASTALQKSKEAKRQRMLSDTFDVVQTYKEQDELGVKTDISEQQYKQTLQFRETLRKMQ